MNSGYIFVSARMATSNPRNRLLTISENSHFSAYYFKFMVEYSMALPYIFFR